MFEFKKKKVLLTTTNNIIALYTCFLLLFFRSGAEDDVWETAGEGLSPPALPLTLEEACEFVDTWHRTHSQSGGGGSMEIERMARRNYQRLGEEEEGGEEEGEEEGDGSSTEVGGGLNLEFVLQKILGFLFSAFFFFPSRPMQQMT